MFFSQLAFSHYQRPDAVYRTIFIFSSRRIFATTANSNFTIDLNIVVRHRHFLVHDGELKMLDNAQFP